MQARPEAQQAAASPWVDRLGRAGLTGKGVLYAVIALLALQVAVGSGGQTVDQQGALQALAGQPFGTLLLALMTVGLAGYALLRLVQLVVNPEGDSGASLWVRRAGYAVRALAYGSLCLLTVRLMMGSGSDGGGEPGSATARLLALPFGVAVVVALGMVVVAVGLYEGFRGVTHKFDEDLRTGQMRPAERRWVPRVAQAGLLARMVVFCLIGGFLVRAALQYDPSQAVGLDGALSQVAQQPYGKILLGIVAAGLLAYAVFCFVLARYGTVRTLT